MSTQLSKSDSKLVLSICHTFKTEAKNNNMLGASVPVIRLKKEYNMTPEEIQSTLKKVECYISIPHIYNYIKMSKLPKKVKDLIKVDKIKGTDVLGLMHKHQSDKELIDVVEKEIERKEKEEHAKKAEREQRKTIQKVETLQTTVEHEVETLFGDKKIPNKYKTKIKSLTGQLENIFKELATA